MTWSTPWHRIVANDLKSSGGIMSPIVGPSGRRNRRTASTAEVGTEYRYTRSRHGGVTGVWVRILGLV